MSKRALIPAFFVLLFVLHQDFWWRDDPTLVLGILPVSLAYHVFWTVLVAIGWYLVARFCWPHELDEEPAAAEPLRHRHPARGGHGPRAQQGPLNSHHSGEKPVPRPNRPQTNVHRPITLGLGEAPAPPPQSERPER